MAQRQATPLLMRSPVNGHEAVYEWHQKRAHELVAGLGVTTDGHAWHFGEPVEGGPSYHARVAAIITQLVESQPVPKPNPNPNPDPNPNPNPKPGPNPNPNPNQVHWAQLWPGGLELGQLLLAHPALAHGREVVELGTGLGTAAVCAALTGATACSKWPLGSAPARLLCLLRARLAAPTGSALPGRGQPTGCPARVLKRAASKVTDFTALDHAGATAVWATDIEPRALAFAAANAAENGLASTVHPLRWDFTQPPPAEIAGRAFGLLLAADVTYFQAAAARVAELAIELVEPGGALLFVDGTDRPYDMDDNMEQLRAGLCADGLFSEETLFEGERELAGPQAGLTRSVRASIFRRTS